MSTCLTKICFFTGQDVISCYETDGSSLDGYYYTILFNGKIREIRLYAHDDWQNDVWVNKFGHSFLVLLDKLNEWSIFKHARNIVELKDTFQALKENNN